ncbi:MAG: hypothetical protein DIZ80_05835 [endosymbiont of Galathealinum brachiosum]|uniref:DUF2846 domain-containing protein n=1 Tax=endosymbiont of Galathealinum brachiosum TaxID=2200906 RepID=A0A370DJF4_9GAMM|nr:MAG: hypothetical protein DIZ80_05835 [endosymbiont of Galathealinum brachiosum]
MHSFKIITIFIAIISAVSCTKKTANFVEFSPVKESESVLYIYRPYSMSNIVITPDVLIDGKKQAEIENNKYIYLNLPQGEHNIELDLTERYAGQQSLILNIEEGKVIYLRVNTSMKFQMNKPYDRSFSIEEINKETARLEIQDTVYAGKKSKKKKENKVGDSEKQEEVKEDQFSIDKTRNPFGK